MGNRMETITERSETGVCSAIAMRLAEKIERVAAEKNVCVLGIVGGRSIPAILDMLLPYAPRLKGMIRVFWLDERIDNDKNYAPALKHLEQLRRHGVDVLWYPLQSMNKQAMMLESKQVFSALKEFNDPVGFDIVLLSSGEDGHIASLFPTHHHVSMKHAGYEIVENAPKKPSERVTATPQLILTARTCFLLFVGEKREAYEQFNNPTVAVADCPAKLVLQIPDLIIGIFLK